MKVIDEIISEPLGGAHRNIKVTCESVKNSISEYFEIFKEKSSDEIIKEREKKYLGIGKDLLEN